MNFRQSYGLPPKPRHDCPICGTETQRGRKCSTHYRDRIRELRWLVRFLAQCVDEARS